jgi:phage internal scaffolding protein
MKKTIKERKNGSRKVTLDCVGASKTRASQQKETDINGIIAKYDRTGTLTHITRSIPRFDDVSELSDYKSALDHVLKAQQMFNDLPSELRSEFDNDPAKFIDYISDSKNHEDAVKKGLVMEADTNMDGVVDAAEKAKEAKKPEAAAKSEPNLSS